MSPKIWCMKIHQITGAMMKGLILIIPGGGDSSGLELGSLPLPCPGSFLGYGSPLSLHLSFCSIIVWALGKPSFPCFCVLVNQVFPYLGKIVPTIFFTFGLMHITFMGLPLQVLVEQAQLHSIQQFTIPLISPFSHRLCVMCSYATHKNHGF